MDDIAPFLFNNINLWKVYLNNNKFKSAVAVKIVKSLQNSMKLTVLNLRNNNISKYAADDIAIMILTYRNSI